MHKRRRFIRWRVQSHCTVWRNVLIRAALHETMCAFHKQQHKKKQFKLKKLNVVWKKKAPLTQWPSCCCGGGGSIPGTPGAVTCICYLNHSVTSAWTATNRIRWRLRVDFHNARRQETRINYGAGGWACRSSARCDFITRPVRTIRRLLIKPPGRAPRCLRSGRRETWMCVRATICPGVFNFNCVN